LEKEITAKKSINIVKKEFKYVILYFIIIKNKIINVSIIVIIESKA